MNRRGRIWTYVIGAMLIGIEAFAAAGDLPLEYRWEDGFQYRCSFEVQAAIADSKHRARGMTIYTPVAGEPSLPAAKQTPSATTGTAFAISPDGVLVTCAHVVKGATNIKAHFGEKVYTAKALRYDAEHDLAILKIDARKLPYLGFLDSEKAELAQEIRVVGYPLTARLGESIKMSRGTISGIIKREDENRFQIDARVNPGNSGGPLVDEQGRVVGIASELLTSKAIESIGFAIPSNEAVKLLRKHGSRISLPVDAKTLTGPDLAKKVTPAVALLKVQIGPGGVATKKRKALRFSGVYNTGNSIRSGHKSESGELVIDSCGEIVSFDGENKVPFLMESLGTMGIELLPGDDRKSWSAFRMVAIAAATESSSRPLLPSYYRSPSSRSPYRPYYPPSYSPTLRPPSRRNRLLPTPYSRDPVETKVTKWTPAVEEVEYTRVSQSAEGAVKIAKKYHLYTVKKEDNDTRMLDMKYEGTFTWDKGIGCVNHSESKGEITLNRSNITLRIPISMKYDMVKQKPKKPEPRRTSPRKPGVKPDIASKGTTEPAARKIEASAGSKPSSLESAPSSSGLSKFKPND